MCVVLLLLSKRNRAENRNKQVLQQPSPTSVLNESADANAKEEPEESQAEESEAESSADSVEELPDDSGDEAWGEQAKHESTMAVSME
jgi:hypothetical protein